MHNFRLLLFTKFSRIANTGIGIIDTTGHYCISRPKHGSGCLLCRCRAFRKNKATGITVLLKCIECMSLLLLLILLEACVDFRCAHSSYFPLGDAVSHGLLNEPVPFASKRTDAHIAMMISNCDMATNGRSVRGHAMRCHCYCFSRDALVVGAD